jgi:hypothetical protein
MFGDRNKGIWARLTSGLDRRLRRQKDDDVGDDAFYDAGDVMLALDRDDNGPYVADADNGAKRRAEFSQHISS